MIADFVIHHIGAFWTALAGGGLGLVGFGMWLEDILRDRKLRHDADAFLDMVDKREERRAREDHPSGFGMEA